MATGAWLLLSMGERCPEAYLAIITPISVSHYSLGCRFLTFIPCKGTLDTQVNQNFGEGDTILHPQGTAHGELRFS